MAALASWCSATAPAGCTTTCASRSTACSSAGRCPKGRASIRRASRSPSRSRTIPIAYGWFEGIIPSGYGKGDVVLWDDGWWEPDPEYPDEPDAATAIGRWRVQVRAHRPQAARPLPARAHGRKPGEDDDQWLLMHKQDDDAVPGWDPEDHPRSVFSARTNEDVADGPARPVGAGDVGGSGEAAQAARARRAVPGSPRRSGPSAASPSRSPTSTR